MRCPFLKETHVRSCNASAFRKMIAEGTGTSSDERCASSRFVECELLQKQKMDHDVSLPEAQCPFFHQSLVQYCEAAPVRKFIPYSESVLTKCGTDNYRYCTAYRSLAEPTTGEDQTSSDCLLSAVTNGEINIDGIRVPHDLWFSRNHMWLDWSVEGSCHVGVDEFFVMVVGVPDRLYFITPRGECHPTVVVTVRGVDYYMMFPYALTVISTNAALRINPRGILTDPYSVGWLFEGTAVRPADLTWKSQSGLMVPHGLIKGADALSWMHEDVQRLTGLVHEMILRESAEQGNAVMMDGGRFARGLSSHVQHNDVRQLFNEFFSSSTTWKFSTQ